jgi:hypothetical protein
VKVIIEGLSPLADGEYEFDWDFTNRDLHEIKQISGVRAGELEEAGKAGDNDLIVAVAHIVLHRYGKDIPLDVLWDAPAGAKINFDFSEDEAKVDAAADAGPPSQPKTESESPETLSGASETSGNGSSNDGDHLASIRPVTGLPVSDTGATSGRAISAG